MSRVRRKAWWPQAAGQNVAPAATATTSLFSDPNIVAGDIGLVVAANAAAATLGEDEVVCTAGVCTINHASAAGGELWNVVIIPMNMTEQ